MDSSLSGTLLPYTPTEQLSMVQVSTARQSTKIKDSYAICVRKLDLLQYAFSSNFCFLMFPVRGAACNLLALEV